MKKRITLVLLIILCTSIISGCTNLDYDKDGQTVYNYERCKGHVNKVSCNSQ